MAGLGTILVLLMGWRFYGCGAEDFSPPLGCSGRCCSAFPLPYIAKTAGWMTAEIGRQPWLVYGLCAPAKEPRQLVHPGNALFTLLGFLGLYLLLGILFLFLIAETIRHGPTGHSAGHC